MLYLIMLLLFLGIRSRYYNDEMFFFKLSLSVVGGNFPPSDRFQSANFQIGGEKLVDGIRGDLREIFLRHVSDFSQRFLARSSVRGPSR